MTNNYVNDFTPSMREYYKKLVKCKPLSRQEEKKMVLLAQEGNEDARNTLIRSNLRFVFQVASKYKGRGADMEDLVSEGNMGLIKAIEKFEPKKNTKLITYAVWWIKYYITEFISNRNAIDTWEKDEDTINFSFKENALSSDEDDYVTYKDVMCSSKEYDDDEERRYNCVEMAKILLNTLDNRERKIVEEYYGIGGNDLNLDEISQECGISIERVRQIKEKALKKLRTEALVHSFSI